jgi:hypothetical protein
MLTKMAVTGPVVNQLTVVPASLLVPLAVSVLLLDKSALFKKYFLGAV